MSDASPATHEKLPARTTPTWEMEVLLSGATVFALFQAYGEINVGLFWLLERLSPENAGLFSPLGLYLQGGVLGLALGFLVHLLLRAVWVALVGLHSVDPAGSMRHNENLGPAQRAHIGEAWDALPQRIAQLDDTATLVFALALGLAKIMGGLFVYAGTCLVVALLVSFLSGGRIAAETGFFGMLTLIIMPLMAATLSDNHAGRRNRDTPRWAARLIGAYRSIGMTADHNLGMSMATYRASGAKRSWRGNAMIGAVVTGILIIVLVVPMVQNRGIGALLNGDFPSSRDGDAGVLQAEHYLDRVRDDAPMRWPLLPSELITGPYLRLHIPYVPEWHDAVRDRCTPPRAPRGSALRLQPTDQRAALACIAETQPILVDGKPVTSPWLYSENERLAMDGFIVMIDIRNLPRGAHELTIGQPEAARRERDDDQDAPWHIPFWN